MGELREGESPSGEEMARIVQEGLPPGSQSMPTSRPLRSPPPVPRALVGLKAADPGTNNRQKPVLTPWDGPEQRPGPAVGGGDDPLCPRSCAPPTRVRPGLGVGGSHPGQGPAAALTCARGSAPPRWRCPSLG